VEEQSMPKATHGAPDHPLKIGDIQIPCYVLEEGRRVLIQSNVIKAIGISRGGSGGSGGDRLAKFIGGKIIKSFITKGLDERTANPIRFKTTRGNMAYGYEATILADICEAILQARKEGVLQKQQEHIAEQCEILIRGFARVGIIALVDEATGYQEVRDRNELNRILEAYIAKELLPWTKRFPDEFYEQLFRLLNWQYSPLSASRPGYVGTLTKQLVYEKLPPGVLEKLMENNPSVKGRRKHKHHQFLTEDIGNPHLEKHLTAVITLMRISSNYKVFKKHFDKALPNLP
jgi:hypothetical protein